VQSLVALTAIRQSELGNGKASGKVHEVAKGQFVQASGKGCCQIAGRR